MNKELTSQIAFYEKKYGKSLNIESLKKIKAEEKKQKLEYIAKLESLVPLQRSERMQNELINMVSKLKENL